MKFHPHSHPRVPVTPATRPRSDTSNDQRTQLFDGEEVEELNHLSRSCFPECRSIQASSAVKSNFTSRAALGIPVWIPLTRNLFDFVSPIPSQNMETGTSNPLECYECKGVLLPDRAMRLQNGGCVLRYVCISCRSRSYAVCIGSAVRVYPSRAVENVMDTPEVIV